MSFNPAELTQERLQDLRRAAEAAWGDDVRSPNFVGHPQPSAGCCMVTSKWLASKLGGDAAIKNGHWVWLSPDRDYVIDLTGDAHAEEPQPGAGDERERHRPGPVMFKRSKHWLYRGLRVKDVPDSDRTRLFAKRADAALDGRLPHEADLAGSDAYPGEEPQAVEDMNRRYMHDEPWVYDRPEDEYKFVWVNGRLQVSPYHRHDELMRHASADPDSTGPMAVGYVRVKEGESVWSAETNVAFRALAEPLKRYAASVGWRWGGLLSGDDRILGPKRAMYYRSGVDGMLLSEKPFKSGRRIEVEGKVATAYGVTSKDRDALQEWAEDFGLRLAEVPGGGNMHDRMHNREHLEMFDNGDPEWQPEPQPTEPEGPLPCKECGKVCRDFMEYQMHADDHDSPMVEQIEDGHFPQPGELDDPLPARRHHNTPDASVIAALVPVHEARRVPDFDRYSGMWSVGKTDDPRFRHYVAYVDGEPLGCLTMQGSEESGSLIMVHSARPKRGIGKALIKQAQQHYAEISTGAMSKEGRALIVKSGFVQVGKDLYKWAAGKDPKDLVTAPIPIVYDIQKDTIAMGVPGSKTADVVGAWTPGGIVEGYFEPGGKLVINTATTIPWTVYHMVQLWYATNPTLEVTSVMLQDQTTGQETKLAHVTSAIDIGSYVRTMAATDVAAWRAYQALKAEGGRVYVVGGAVRDALLGRDGKDVDLMVAGLAPEKVEHTLERLGGQVNLTGKRFGVYRYKTQGKEVEVALPRTDEYSNGRRSDGKITVDPNLPIERDLQRRDFTVNSMAVDLDNGTLVDPFHGAQDARDGVLRTTHPDSFAEDPSRLVRALTMTSRYGLHPDSRTRYEMQQDASKLDGESPDVLKQQLDKLMAADRPSRGIRLAQETGVLGHLFPELSTNFDFDQRNPHHTHSLGEHSLHVLENIEGQTKDPDLRLAALLHDVGKPSSAWADPATGTTHFYPGMLDGKPVGADHAAVGADMADRRLRETFNYPVARIQRIRELVRHHMYPDFSSPKGARKFLHNVGEHADDLMTLRQADRDSKGTDEYQGTKTPVDTQRGLVEQARSAQDPTQQSALSVNGNDIMAMGVPSGPLVGEVLRRLTDAVLEDPSANQRDRLLQLASEYSRALVPQS